MGKEAGLRQTELKCKRTEALKEPVGVEEAPADTHGTVMVRKSVIDTYREQMVQLEQALQVCDFCDAALLMMPVSLLLQLLILLLLRLLLPLTLLLQLLLLLIQLLLQLLLLRLLLQLTLLLLLLLPLVLMLLLHQLQLTLLLLLLLLALLLLLLLITQDK